MSDNSVAVWLSLCSPSFIRSLRGREAIERVVDTVRGKNARELCIACKHLVRGATRHGRLPAHGELPGWLRARVTKAQLAKLRETLESDLRVKAESSLAIKPIAPPDAKSIPAPGAWKPLTSRLEINDETAEIRPRQEAGPAFDDQSERRRREADYARQAEAIERAHGAAFGLVDLARSRMGPNTRSVWCLEPEPDGSSLFRPFASVRAAARWMAELMGDHVNHRVIRRACAEGSTYAGRRWGYGVGAAEAVPHGGERPVACPTVRRTFPSIKAAARFANVSRTRLRENLLKDGTATAGELEFTWGDAGAIAAAWGPPIAKVVKRRVESVSGQMLLPFAALEAKPVKKAAVPQRQRRMECVAA